MLITVLCAGCLNVVDIEGSPKDYEILEFFAGERRLAKLGAGLGKSNASMDKMYDDGDNISKTNAMDLNTSVGFLPLISSIWQNCFIFFRLVYPHVQMIIIPKYPCMLDLPFP